MFQNETSTTPLPLNSAWFLLPFLVAFELGMIVYAPHELPAGLAKFLVPGLFSALFVGVLGLQQFCYQSKHPLANKNDLFKQSKQSLTFGLIPALLILVTSALTAPQLSKTATDLSIINNELAGRLIFSAIRAGLLEEFFFRLVLLSGLLGLLLGLKFSRQSSLLLAVTLSSCLFAVAHDPCLINGSFSIEISSLLFYRFSAGVYLAAIYLHHGLGVATGSHIVYDLTIGCWN